MSNGENTCERLAKAVAELDMGRLPPAVVRRAKWAVLDFLASLFAGLKHGEIASPILDIVRHGAGTPEASVAGSAQRVPAAQAALAHGTVAHAVELDDGHRYGTAHPAVAVIPAALAVAERLGSSGTELLVAVVAGYEAMLRIATAINPGHWRRGFHTTGTCGGIGAAAAVAKLMGLSAEQTGYAISMGALQGAGLQQMLYSNAMIKPLQSGRAAQAGVFAGELACRGARSPLSVFEGSLGFFGAMTDVLCLGEAMRGFGTHFEIERTYFKFYPSCRHVHCSLDLLRAVLQEQPVLPEAVESVEVRTYSIAVKEVGKPDYPGTPDEAMFSIPYAVAVWLHERRLTLDQFAPESLRRGDLRATAAKVSVVSDPAWDAEYPQRRGATLDLRLRNGQRIVRCCGLPRGEPETLSDGSQLVEKFMTCTRGVLAEPIAAELVDSVGALEKAGNVDRLGAAIRDAKAFRPPKKPQAKGAPVRLVPLTWLARTVRSKNAKTHHVTLEIIFDNRTTYERVTATGAITPESIAALYRVPVENVVAFVNFDPGMGIKATMKRPLVSGSPGEFDVYGCQQYAPLFDIMVPWPWEDGILEEET